MIHPNAVVSNDSTVDRDAAVWQFASVIRAAHIGLRSSVGACAVVDMSYVSADVRIGHGAQIHPGMRIEHNVFIGPGVIFCNDRFPSPEHGGGFDFTRYNRLKPCIIVDPGAAIGAAAVVLPGVRIGGGAVVAARATVEEDVPPDHILHRDGSLEKIGHKRRPRHGFAPDTERMKL